MSSFSFVEKFWFWLFRVGAKVQLLSLTAQLRSDSKRLRLIIPDRAPMVTSLLERTAMMMVTIV